MIHDNRESWLNGVAAGMAPLFEALRAPLPDRVRVAIGFTRGQSRQRYVSRHRLHRSGRRWCGQRFFGLQGPNRAGVGL